MLFFPVIKARSFTRASLCFFWSLVFSLTLSSCAQKDPVLLLSGPTMGTSYHIKLIPGKAAVSLDILREQVDETLQSINQSMSTYIEDSELSQLNRAPVDTWIEISEPLLEVLLISQEVSEISGGAFDITAGPLVNLWGFGPEQRDDQVPDDAAIQSAMERVGYRKLEIDEAGQRVKKTAGLYLDLSAVAKGYATDVLAELLLRQGVENFMVEIGGELRLAGVNAQGKSWRIGIEKPGLLHEGALQAVDVTDAGMATSGDYRNYIEVEGERYSHTIDPSTGRPIKHRLASVSVITDTGARADAFATALNVMGPERGYELAASLDLAAYFIIREEEGFSVKYTPEFEQYLVEP